LENLHLSTTSQEQLLFSELRIRISRQWIEVSVTVKFLASFEEIMTESINNKKSKLAETMGQFPILDQITKQSKVMMGYCCKVQNF